MTPRPSQPQPGADEIERAREATHPADRLKCPIPPCRAGLDETRDGPLRLNLGQVGTVASMHPYGDKSRTSWSNSDEDHDSCHRRHTEPGCWRCFCPGPARRVPRTGLRLTGVLRCPTEPGRRRCLRSRQCRSHIHVGALSGSQAPKLGSFFAGPRGSEIVSGNIGPMATNTLPGSGGRGFLMNNGSGTTTLLPPVGVPQVVTTPR
jgi:hypothetical protein